MSDFLTYSKALESLILTGKTEECLKNLVENSKEACYIKFIEELKKCEQEKKISKEINDIIEKMKNLHFDTEFTKQCNIMKELMEYDFPSTSEKQKDKIINDLKNNFYGESFDFPMPNFANFKKQDENKSKTMYPSILTEKLFEDKLNEYNLKGENNNEIFKIVNLNNLKRKNEFINILKNSDSKKLNKIIQNREYIPFYLLNDEEFTLLINNSGLIKKFWDLNFSLFTINQLEKLLNLEIKDFDKNILIQNIINKKYKRKFFINNEKNDLKENKKLLLEILEYIKSNPKLKNFKSSIIFHLLDNGIQLNEYDLDLFNEYIQYPCNRTDPYLFNNQFQNNFYELMNVGLSEHSYNLINVYLDYFFLNDKANVETFQKYIKIDLLEKEFYKCNILKGKDVKFNEKLMSKFEYEEFCKSSKITICPYNKKVFEIGEKILIDIELKNIQNLNISVFEINTENYYLEKKSPITSLINVEGILTKIEENFTFEENSTKLVTKTFDLSKHISNEKRGVYLIEIIGNGLSSRIILKIGTLNLITRNTSKGKICYIINEKNEVMKGPKTYIWYNKHQYKCEEEKGMIVIPYSVFVPTEDKCILCHEDYSDISTIETDSERYELKGMFYINHEALMTGNICKASFKPIVLVNKRKANINLLKNCKITINIIKEIDGKEIPVINEIEDVNFNENDEFDFEINIPPLLKTMNLKFSCEIMNLTNRQKIPYEYNQNIPINFNMNNILYEYYLRKVMKENKEEYICEVLGKNGEEISDKNVNIEFKMLNLKQTLSILFQTNKEGKIFLGNLENIEYLKIEGKFFNINKNSKYSYPDTIDLCENEEILLPYFTKEKNVDIILYEHFDGEIISYLKNEDNIEIKNLVINNDSKHYYELKIKKLLVGKYCLYLNDNLINIEVHEGEHWMGMKNFIMKKDCLIENCENITPIYLNSFEYSKENKEIKFTLNNNKDNKNIHANIFLYNYLPNDYNSYFDKYVKMLYDRVEFLTVQSFSQWKNIYLSNRILNEEIQYVMQRKLKENSLGNSLEMPSLLLKRQFTKSSNIEQEVLEKGSNYKKADANLNKKMKTKLTSRNENIFESLISYNCFSNFIKNPPMILNNIKMTENEFIIKYSDLNKYSFAQIILIDDNSINSNLITLNDEKFNVEKRNVFNEKILDNMKNYCEIKKTEIYLKDQKFSVNELSDFKLIDSIKKILTYLLVKNPSFKEKWEKLKFLLNLENFNEKNFLEKYTEFASHEVNIFIYFKFPEIFEKYIKNILIFKYEKTFIDYFLLDDKVMLKKFLTSVKLSKLNTFELCLLMLKIVEENPEDAKKIRNIIKNRINLTNEETILHNFDIMMNMKVDSDFHQDPREMALKEEKDGWEKCEREEECNNLEEDIDELEDMMMNEDVDEEERYPKKESYRGFRGRGNKAKVFGIRAKPQMLANMMMATPKMFGASHLNSVMQPPMAPMMMMEQNNLMMDQATLMQSDMFNVNAAHFSNALNINAVTEAEFEKPGQAKEYKERHYYFPEHKDELDSELWLNLADHILKEKNVKNFLSKNILGKQKTINELIWIISIFDLPITNVSHIYKKDEVNNRTLIITPQSNLLLFTKEICESNLNINNKILISQNISSNSNYNSNMEIDENNILVGNKYTHETILTNINNQVIDFEIFVQIPEGSIPLEKTYYTQTHHIVLNGFETISYPINFYFPKTGTFSQYHPVAIKDGSIISIGKPLTYTVKDEIVFNQINDDDENNKYKEDTYIPGKIEEILSKGDKNSILEYFEKSPILQNDLNHIYWLLKDKEYFLKLISILRKRGMFDRTVWAFGFKHKDIATIKEYLNNEDYLKKFLGENFNSSLCSVNEIDEGLNPHLDYYPVFNARMHPLGKRENYIENVELKKVYEKFIIKLLGMRKINSRNYLRLVYYLILQERIDEANEVFKKIDLKEIEGDKNKSNKIQYDYINAYLDFYFGYPNFTIAKEISSKYKNFPLLYWREKFEEIEDELLEYEGKEKISLNNIENLNVENKDDLKIIKKNLKLKEPKLSFSIEKKKLEIIHSNIKQITIKFYLIDLEVLFSRNPSISLMNNNTEHNEFSYVSPNYIKIIETKENEKIENLTVFDIPNEFYSKNILIEVSSDSIKKFNMYFSSEIKIIISENLGELKVLNQQLKPVIKAYIKVFVKLNYGEPKFYKDGYTDLRGQFNYLDLNTDQLKDAEKFYIFASEDNLGVKITECNPPRNIGENDEQINLGDIQKYRQTQRAQWRKANKI